MATKEDTSSSTVVQMEEKIREQIRELQEKRAAAMITEITELQRERDLALTRIRQLQKGMDEIRAENHLLKSSLKKERDLKQEMKMLERAFLEEQLLNNELRKKLQVTEKKRAELVAKLQDSPSGSASPLLQYRVGQPMTRGVRSVSLSNLPIQLGR